MIKKIKNFIFNLKEIYILENNVYSGTIIYKLFNKFQFKIPFNKFSIINQNEICFNCSLKDGVEVNIYYESE